MGTAGTVGKSAPVGIVVTDWFNLSLYKIAVGLPWVSFKSRRHGLEEGFSSIYLLVFPAASRPNINNLISLLPKRRTWSAGDKRTKLVWQDMWLVVNGNILMALERDTPMTETRRIMNDEGW
jgi:hypothetical protein